MTQDLLERMRAEAEVAVRGCAHSGGACLRCVGLALCRVVEPLEDAVRMGAAAAAESEERRDRLEKAEALAEQREREIDAATFALAEARAFALLEQQRANKAEAEVERLKDKVCGLGLELHQRNCQIAEHAARLAEVERQAAAAMAALAELVEVADLRGDSDLPHPCDDPKLWTARMITAWEEARAALEGTAGRDFVPRAEHETVQAQVAAMRAALERIAAPFIVTCEQAGFMRDDAKITLAALQPDAGRGWLSPQEVRRVAAAAWDNCWKRCDKVGDWPEWNRDRATDIDAAVRAAREGR